MNDKINSLIWLWAFFSRCLRVIRRDSMSGNAAPQTRHRNWCPSVKFMGDNLDDEILMLRWCNKNHGWKSDFHFQPEFRVCSETRFIGKGMSFNNSGHIDVVHWLGRARGASALLQWAGLWWRHVVRIKAMKLLRQSKTQVHDILPKCKGRKNTSY